VESHGTGSTQAESSLYHAVRQKESEYPDHRYDHDRARLYRHGPAAGEQFLVPDPGTDYTNNRLFSRRARVDFVRPQTVLPPGEHPSGRTRRPATGGQKEAKKIIHGLTRIWTDFTDFFLPQRRKEGAKHAKYI
jgi:hypothetical protein